MDALTIRIVIPGHRDVGLSDLEVNPESYVCDVALSGGESPTHVRSRHM
jgi:hypothetical protein